MTTTTEHPSTDVAEEHLDDVEAPATDPTVEATEDPPVHAEDEPDTFPREYVEKLRDENARYRQRAQRADDLAHRLHTALVAATGRLADPSDLDFAEAHLDDEEALSAAIEDLLARKPHLTSRRPRGDVGQGLAGSTPITDLAGILRSRA